MRNRQTQAEPGKTLSILLVGDQQVILQAMRSWLAPLGHRLTWVKNGLEAINQLRFRHFDMVMTELAAPGLDESLIAQFLRHSKEHTTLVGLSSDWYRDQPGDLAAARQSCLYPSIQRPVPRAKQPIKPGMEQISHFIHISCQLFR